MPFSDPRQLELLHRHQFIRTSDPEKWRASLLAACNAVKVDLPRDKSRFFALTNKVQLQHVGLSFCGFDADVAIEFSEAGLFRQHICLAGAGEAILNKRSIPLSIRDTCVIPPEARSAARFAAGFCQLVVRLEPGALRSKLNSLIGAAAKGRLEFASAASFESPRLQNLRRLVLFLANELDCASVQLPDLAIAELEQALLVSFLCAHTHNFSALLEKPAQPADPWRVRLAEAYIEANWNRPITVEAISQATGVSVRSIFKSFRDKRGCSPMSFVKGVRLRQAREMLRRAEAATSVTGVAFECGFHNLGHFAKEYRRLFGELPSETLNMAQAGHAAPPNGR